ncbi:MAG: hypothetical protein Kow0092_05500 [Deferrisomatales bacterium]
MEPPTATPTGTGFREALFGNRTQGFLPRRTRSTGARPEARGGTLLQSTERDGDLDTPPAGPGALARPLPALDDPEGERVPSGLPPVVDAHVHVFPEPLMAAIRRWFDAHGWPARYRLSSEELIDFLLSRGVVHLVLLHYAHRPGVARGLNRYMAELCRKTPRVTGLATVFPGEPGAEAILAEALDLGLAGVKLHAHVQGVDVGGPEVRRVCEWCAARGAPVVAHFGREPKSPAYSDDPHALCGAERVSQLLETVPELRLCVPHLGADEFEAYARLQERYDNLWLDTTMMLAGYFPGMEPPPLERFRLDRVMYGSDFCNLPYAWDRELKAVAAAKLEREEREGLLWRNAARFFSLDVQGSGGESKEQDRPGKEGEQGHGQGRSGRAGALGDP